jgi:hypothetical protein
MRTGRRGSWPPRPPARGNRPETLAQSGSDD